MKTWIKLLLSMLLCFTLAACASSKKTETTTGTTVEDVEEDDLDNDEDDEDDEDEPTILIKVKNYGEITVVLDPEEAPTTVENFLKLVDEKFYDGLTFHRIISGFMIQGGDPNGNGTGGSKEKIKGEFSANGYENNIAHKRGVISMARSQDYNSASSQFFIMHADASHLDGQYAAFGYVIKGMDVVDAICKKASPIDRNGSIAKDQQPIIESITRVS